LTYETNWRCTHCQVESLVSIPYSQGGHTILDEAAKQHSEMSPDCAAARGSSGIALQAAKPTQELH